MKKTKKILLSMAAVALVAAISIAGTVAYLTSTTSEVTNTFTVGNVEITLDEAKVDEYGVKDTTTTARVTENEYKLIPGHKYVKDPTIHVAEGSEDCWLAVKIENGLGTDATITMAEGWTQDTTDTTIWYYGTKQSAEADVVVFSDFTFGSTADPADYANAEIVITGYAVQADGFTSAADAYAAGFPAPTATTTPTP